MATTELAKVTSVKVKYETRNSTKEGKNIGHGRREREIEGKLRECVDTDLKTLKQRGRK